MRAREAQETAVDIMAHNVKKMNDRELLKCGFLYMNRIDDEGKEILRLIEEEQNKRGIY